MKGVVANILETIGRTPIVPLRRVNDTPATVLAKLEMFNPSGSIKARAAYGMIIQAEREGRIKPGDVIIEATSGNQGIGLAMVGAVKGYRVIVVMPETMSVERRQLARAYGAEVVLTPAGEDVGGAVNKARELGRQIPNSWLPDQFNNPANPDFHSQTTAQEILEQVAGPIDVLAAGVGTGGTLTGIARVLKQRYPQIRIVAIEPKTSAVLSGGQPGPHKIQGIGDGFVPGNLERSLVDEVYAVGDEEAIEMTKRLAREEGILTGISGGAAACAAIGMGKKLGRGTVLTILADTGERYLSGSVFD